MKTIYIDSEFKCHTTDDGTMTVIETDFFDGKCDEFIEGYRFVPIGETWKREDGEIFEGEMIAPAEEYFLLANAQMEHDLEMVDEYKQSLLELGVEL